MTIVCKSCGASVPADDVNIDNMLAKCRQCDAVFDISNQVHGREEQPSAPHVDAPRTHRRRPQVPLPPGLKVTRSGSVPGATQAAGPYREAGHPSDRSLKITRRWYSHQHLGMLFFCIAWDSFLVFWYTMAGASGNWLMILFPIAHVAVGVSLTYATLAGLFNRTRITVTDQRLAIKHYPIPWRGNHNLAARDLEQLYVERVGGNSDDASENYRLCAVLRSGSKLNLVKKIDQADQALFMEQEIESLLGIIDVEVGDEYQP